MPPNAQVNDLEQLCINLTNEKLQQHFNTHVFKWEQVRVRAATAGGARAGQGGGQEARGWQWRAECGAPVPL